MNRTTKGGAFQVDATNSHKRHFAIDDLREIAYIY
jgi:hypothetical protein